MAKLIFYEKPGCIGNRRQKNLLRIQGLGFEVRDLLSEPWTAQGLRPFFGNKPVAEWFNQSAPQVKSGELAIGELDEQQAIALMLLEPLLICRPLLRFGALCQSGFVPGPVVDALGIPLAHGADLQSCPMTGVDPRCEVPQSV